MPDLANKAAQIADVPTSPAHPPGQLWCPVTSTFLTDLYQDRLRQFATTVVDDPDHGDTVADFVLMPNRRPYVRRSGERSRAKSPEARLP